MRTLQIRLGLWIQRRTEFVHRNEFNVEETGNEATLELPHLLEQLPHVIGVLFS
jgi:hypothetical protein